MIPIRYRGLASLVLVAACMLPVRSTAQTTGSSDEILDEPFAWNDAPAFDDATFRDLSRLISDSPQRIILDVWGGALTQGAAAVARLHVSVESGGSNSITVARGAEVRYEVVGLLSDDANEGLALVGFDLVFDGGDLIPADEPFGEPALGCESPMINFTKPWGITNPAGYGGTVIDGNLIQVGGGQNTINNTLEDFGFLMGPVLTGVAQPSGCGPAVLVTGTVTAPLTDGTYNLAIMELFANIIVQGETGEVFWASAAAGVGTLTNLRITVSGGPRRYPVRRGARPDVLKVGRNSSRP
ncbi:MAG: hypothetical protein IIC01_13280 [Planctomycetes bacterium]|nr:hypothetical protein [Planctomycetota bacterium]